MKTGGVGRAFERGKLSPAIPGQFALCGPLSSQKNFCSTCPHVTRRFPLSYPRKYVFAQNDVENSVENAGKPIKKMTQ